MARRLGPSAPVVFLGAFFWTWVLGPVGALLATPISAILRLILDSSEETRWLAVLMSGPWDRQDKPQPQPTDSSVPVSEE